MLKPLFALVLLAMTGAPAFAQNSGPSPEEIYQRSCGNVLNLLPQIVPKRDVAAVPDDAHVVLHRVCTGVDLNSLGNAAGLGKTIAATPALARALARAGYSVDNVVGIRIDGSTVQLYVHRA